MKECVGCGFCCLKAPCQVALRINGGGISRCPHLIWDSSRYVCDLMRLPGKVGEGYREELYAGTGCSCSLNSWREEVICRDEVKVKAAENPISALMQMFLHCLGKQFLSSDVIAMTCYDLMDHLIKDGYGEEEISEIIARILSYFHSNRSRFTSSFMG